MSTAAAGDGQSVIRITRGLDIPLEGKPLQQVEEGRHVGRVALLGRDYVGLKPRLLVQEGDRVRLGQPLFTDKGDPRVVFTSPGSGRVRAINRGERRAFVSLVVELEGDDEILFPAVEAGEIPRLTWEEVEGRLLESGLWTALRTRPFSRVPAPGTRPAAIFVTAIDTDPLAADPAVVIGQRREFFRAGLQLLTPLTAGRVYLCLAEGADIPDAGGITRALFSGRHPAGLVGTHIHFLEPAGPTRQVWHLGYQDVIALGALFLTGRIAVERVVALGGPQVKHPRLLRTRLGADLGELTAGELREGECRVVSGSVLSGQAAQGDSAYLGRYHQQVSVISEGRQRKFLDWLMPGFGKHSATPVFAATLLPRRDLPLDSSTHGSLRAMVPTGAFERVMPLDVKITWLLRTLLTRDTDLAQQLGCLELDEEDLALCSYVCSGKIDYGPHLRHVLNTIEEEGR